jgi:hypothetical protein
VASKMDVRLPSLSFSRYRHYHSCSFCVRVSVLHKQFPTRYTKYAKKKTSESGRSDYVISFVLSLIISGDTQRTRKGGKRESKEKNRSSLLAIKTKLNCSSYQPMLLFRFFFNKRKVRTFLFI